MANQTDSYGRSSADPDPSFNWERFDTMLDGLKADDAASASSATPEAEGEADAAPQQAGNPEFVGPRLPRVDPFELANHKLRARRRRVLARRAENAVTPEEEPEPEPEAGEEFDEHGEQEMAERLANRFAPAGTSGAAAASVYAPPGRHRVEPAEEGRDLDPLDDALERELGDLRPQPLPDKHAWRHGEQRSRSRRRVVVFGSLTAAAILVSGASALALLGDRGDSGAEVSETRAEASPTTGELIGFHDRRSRREPEPDVMAPLMTPPDSVDLAGAQRLVPRRVHTTSFTMPATADPAPEDHPVIIEVPDEPALSVVQGPDHGNTESVSGKSADRLIDGDPAVGAEPVVVAAPAKPAPVVLPMPAKGSAFAYAPTPDDIASEANAAIEVVVPARQEAVGVAPPAAEAAPVELVGQAGSPEPDPTATEEWAEELRIDLLLTRGRELLGSGDLAAARLLFTKVAEAGDPRGATAMAETYDPQIFRRIEVVGLAPDAEISAEWHRRAADLRAGRR